MADNSTTFFNGVNYCYCKSCVIAEAKKLESKNLLTNAFQLLHDAELYYSQIAKELEDQKKALLSRLNENELIQCETIQSSRNVNKNINNSDMRCHPPLNVVCGKQKVQQSLPGRNLNGEFACPVAVFDNKSDPRQKPMYPKHLVYKDGKDVQLEEIRAAIYWERLRKPGTQVSNHPEPEKNICVTRENAAPSNESEFSSERIRTSPDEEIRKPQQNTCSGNLTDFSQQSETNEPHDAINQRKHEVVTHISTIRSPLHEFGSSDIDKLGSGRQINNPARTNENLVTSRQQSKNTVPNITNQTKPAENISCSPRREMKNCQAVTTNRKVHENYDDLATCNQKTVMSPRSDFSAADENTLVQESKSKSRAVKGDAFAELESNKLENVVSKTEPKFSDATFICNRAPKNNAILQETYLIKNGQKLPCSESKSLNTEILKTPKQCDCSGISKLLEKSCVVSSAAKEKRTTKVLSVNGEDKENVLPTSPSDENEQDNTGDTKAFAMILPSSTPNKRRSQFYSNGIFVESRCSVGPRASIASTTLNLSMIPETSRERSSSSSGAGSVAANSKNQIQDKPSLSAIAETEEKSNSLPPNFDISDPFNPELLGQLLGRLQFPCEHHQRGYHLSKTDIPAVKLTNSYKLGIKKYTIAAEIGKGSYARILKAYPSDRPKEQVALKIQKPACVWEYYISKEIRNKLKSEEKLQYFLHYSEIFVFRNCSILLSEWGPYGSLLNFRNALKTTNFGSQDKYPMAVGVYLSIQIVSAVDYLHSCRIIHGDIKPDNFIISSVSGDGRPSIKLIDFGRSIDMTLFPKNTVFYKVIQTEDFTCNEMQDGRAWTYQTDLFGMAGTFYVLLMGDYMKTMKKNDRLWVLKKSLARYMYRDQWDPIFNALLNVPSCNELPNLSVLKGQLEVFYDSFNSFEKKQQFNKVLPVFRNLKSQS